LFRIIFVDPLSPKTFVSLSFFRLMLFLQRRTSFLPPNRSPPAHAVRLFSQASSLPWRNIPVASEFRILLPPASDIPLHHHDARTRKIKGRSLRLPPLPLLFTTGLMSDLSYHFFFLCVLPLSSRRFLAFLPAYLSSIFRAGRRPPFPGDPFAFYNPFPLFHLAPCRFPL